MSGCVGATLREEKKLVIPFQGHDTGIWPAVARLTTPEQRTLHAAVAGAADPGSSVSRAHPPLY
jgi:hypothetical protein